MRYRNDGKSLLFIIASLFLFPLWGWATLATPTTVTSTTVAGSTVTVNSTAHGQSAGQGGCVNGSGTGNNNVCFLIATATTNSYTFTLQSGQSFTACSSSCGTTAPGDLIVFDQVTPFAAALGQQPLVCLFVYTGTGKPKAGGTSACSSATASENAAIVSGAIVEFDVTVLVPDNEPISTLFNTYLDWQTSARLRFNGQSFTTALPGSYLGRRCDTTGCN